MGNICSSKRREKDNASLHSEEYQLAQRRKSSQDSKQSERHSSVKNCLQSNVVLKVGACTEDGECRDLNSFGQHLPQQTKKNGSAFVTTNIDIPSGKPLRPILQNSHSQATTPDRTLFLPEDINDISDTHKQLLLGIIPASKPTALKAKKIIIYVCAADAEECHTEKNILHDKVYPELRKICREEGYELHIVDLHWRSMLEKRRDHKFPELCLFELNRQSEIGHIIPVIFLSNSLGIPLLPKTIDCEDYESILQSADNKNLLKKWYKLDREAQPQCYVLQSIEQHFPNLDDDDELRKEKALKDWNNEVENMLQILITNFNEELRDTYLTTTVEQEIHNTMRMSQELTKHSVWLYRDVRGHEEDGDIDSKCPVAKENNRRLNLLVTELKNELSEKNMINLKDLKTEEQIKNLILPLLSSVIRPIIDDDKSRGSYKTCYYGVSSLLLRELTLQTSFCQKSATAHSISNHNNILNILRSYALSEDERGIMVIHGVPGCGKSTILARFLLNESQNLFPNLVIVFRFTNVSAESSSLELLLCSILQQIHFVIHGRQLWETHNISKYVELFPKSLSVASENRPILIVIDGLDQLHEFANNIDWIPVLLPRNIKFIISVTESAAVVSDIQEKLRDTAVFVEISTLRESESESLFNTLIAESDGITSSYLPASGKIYSHIKENSLPFYVKIIAHQYCWLRNENMIFFQKSEIDLQVNEMLVTLENILGTPQVELTMALLMEARYGLTDSELMDILSYDVLFHSDSSQVVWAPASIFFSEFTKYMRSFLRWFHTCDSVVLYVQHELMRDVLLKRYKYKLNHARQLLHTYFTGSLWDSTETLKIGARVISQPMKYKNAYNSRKLEELPYHEYKLFNTLQKHFLEDHLWLYTKVCACSVYQVLEDVKLETQARHDNETNANLTLIQSFLENCAPALNYDGRQFYSQLLEFLNENQRKLLSNTSNFATTVKTVLRKPPIFSLLSYTDCIKDRLLITEDKIESNENEKRSDRLQFDVIKRIDFVPNLVVTVSTSMQEVAVWDVTNGQLVRKLINISQPMALEMIDEFCCVVLCGRELRVYDLNTGESKQGLKGVMNQKMPYFGLHDSTHVVALSRNRMYVNLLTTETGDLVTSFKAGEDRFLNSLLVSGNGKILVCGDETQKPFPLLVWNLASRKLLYDLRIAHHDFITRLAAITYEGNYVCCVAKEVDDPSPNFIVVYDLQSGTLFKKWKPGVNSVSLDISSKDSCVISGHQNGTISVWDLVTGACKWTFEGHTAPVTCLRLDAMGGAFLSHDSSGRDKSIRLWNLTNGELTAVYTPNKTITAAEILSGGKYVVIAMERSTNLTILHLAGPTMESFCPDRDVCPATDYGSAENYGKIFDLNRTSSNAERCEVANR